MKKLLMVALAFFLVRWSEVNYHFVRGPGMDIYMPHVDRKGGEFRFETFEQARDWMDMMFPPESGVRKMMNAHIVKVEETNLPEPRATVEKKTEAVKQGNIKYDPPVVKDGWPGDATLKEKEK